MPKQKYWLFKSEPDVYSLADLKRDKKTYWEGVRNYQARNLLRDEVKVGDGVLFYHSRVKPMVIAGTYRPAQTHRGHPLLRWIRSLRDHPRALTLTLEPLPPDELTEEGRQFMRDNFPAPEPGIAFQTAAGILGLAGLCRRRRRGRSAWRECGPRR